MKRLTMHDPVHVTRARPTPPRIYLRCLSRFSEEFVGSQLSVVRKKLNVVADVGRRKLSVVTNGTPEKGRRYLTFIHTERALVAIFNLSDHIN